MAVMGLMVKGLWTAILLLEEWGTTQWVVRGRCLTHVLMIPVQRYPAEKTANTSSSV